MSMMGRFVQVSPDRLKEILDDPSGVEELFANEQVSHAMPKLMGALQGQLQRQTPQMLAASMAAMPPEVRERLAQSLKNVGIDPDALARGEGGDALAKLMAQRLQELRSHLPAQPPAPSGSARPSGKGASISIDKAWHGVHYLLCGKVEPGSDLVSQAVMGGTEVGEDLGYGPARYFDANEVAAIARELTRPNLEAEMDARWDPDKMADLGIYPGQFVATEDRQWLMDAFRQLRQFYVDASAAKLAVVTCLE
ncbi:MAG: YfbM family protein [Candidatus Binatus sp.]